MVCFILIEKNIIYNYELSKEEFWDIFFSNHRVKTIIIINTNTKIDGYSILLDQYVNITLLPTVLTIEEYK